MNRTTGRNRPGFTLIELLVVVLIIGILIALLLPAINGAVQSARNAAVSAEIVQLATALEDFKSKYGEYPPSRIILNEDGHYNTSSSTTLLAASGGFFGGGDKDSNIYDPHDLTYGQLCDRSLRFLRKFAPKAPFVVGASTGVKIHDFTGTGISAGSSAQSILLQGNECLVFFLGGIPIHDATGATIGVSGFSKSPTTPFTTASSGTNRSAPMMEFVVSRLIDDDGDGMPGYVDPRSSGGNPRFYAYFSSYGNGGYDPNDNNYAGTGALDPSEYGGPATFAHKMRVNFSNASVAPFYVQSPAPNPYTSNAAYNASAAPVYLKPQSFQIISAGRDGLYGLGGEYAGSNTGSRLPVGPAPFPEWVAADPAGARLGERDNITNFATGVLE